MSAPRSSDAPIGFSWIPTTPAKPNLSKCDTNSQERLTSDNSVSYRELLAIADMGKLTAKADYAAPGNEFKATTVFASPCVQPEMLQGALPCLNVTDGSSSYSRPYFDLNAVPESNAEELSSKNVGPEFEPPTPEKSVRRPTIDGVDSAKDAPNNVEGLHRGERSNLSDNHQLHASVSSTILEGNHRPDKGSTEDADSSKTLQRKPSRKKHRPRVITESKPRAKRKQKVESSVPTQDATPVKRRPGRPKANRNTPSSSPNDGTDSRENTPHSVDTQLAKEEPTVVNTYHRRRSSCRRSLNFNSEGDVNGESLSNCQSRENSVTDKGKAKSDTPIANELAGTSHQELQGDVARQTQHFSSSSPCYKTELPQSCQPLAHNGLYVGEKCQGILSDGSHNKGKNDIQSTINPEREVQTLKRHVDATVQPGFSNMNEMGMAGNSLQASNATFSHGADYIDSSRGWCIPAISKRKRTEKKHIAITVSSPYKITSPDNYETVERCHSWASTNTPSTSTANQGPSSVQHNSINLLSYSVTATHYGQKFLNDLLLASSTETVKRKRSKGRTRTRDIASLMIHNQMPTYQASPSRVEIFREPQTCMEALVAYNSSINSIPKTKKRSKRSMISNGFLQNWDFTSQLMGPPLAIAWKSPVLIDSITEQLSELNLNAEIGEESARNLSMAYHMHYQEQRSLEPYQSDGAVVPFDISFNQTKRRKPRAKVDLDDETNKVWKLLLENINSEGIDGEDEEKAKWWEEERKIFKGRSDSFIARMHLVQGDRRFSPWKGSVVDSVVGVFLTQNVSDHLSSSAFMSLVARYPAKSENHLAGSAKVQEPDSSMLGPDATFRSDRSEQQILDNLFCGEESTVLVDFEADVREVNSTKAPGISSNGSIPRNNLRGQSSDVFKHVPVMSHESCCCINKSISPIRDGRDKEHTILSQAFEISSQSSTYSYTAHTTEISISCLRSTSEEPTALTPSNEFAASSEEQHVVYDKEIEEESGKIAKRRALGGESALCHSCDSETLATVDLSQESFKVLHSTIENETFMTSTSEPLSEAASQTKAVTIEDEPQFSKPNLCSPTEVQVETKILVGDIAGLASTDRLLVDNQSEMKEVLSDICFCSQNSKDIGESSTKADECKKLNSIRNNDVSFDPREKSNQDKAKKTEKGKKKVDWDRLREHAKRGGKQREKTCNTMDSVDWDAVRRADVSEVADAIKERGMNNVLAGRIKDFLDRIVEDHGSIDLEWLRDVPPDNAKEYLLSIRGLGLKSVECVRLLTLHHLAFPVDTNVGRIAVRLGWVPLQPLPESLQLHLLELYPMLESIQKYLWPRLCKLDQKTLYELHYQMITFGKVFCTKSKPNCNACPMRAECRHFASAFASARLSLPAPEEKRIVTTTTEDRTSDQNVRTFMNSLQLPSNIPDFEESVRSNCQPIIEVPPSPEPDIEEVPAMPGQNNIHVPDIEDAFTEDPDEIPTIQLNMKEFTHNLQKIMQQKTELQDGDMTKALVALTAEAASIPVPKLKNISRLRTEHQVYELPDSHPLLEGLDKREFDDPCPYMLAIWTPGETVNSIEPPKRQCNSQESEKLCNDETCSSCNSIREAALDTVRGTLLIPCRTAMRGSFPLNGTYFQVNEVFADHESSLTPMNIPRQWLWHLPRRTVFFGTSIPTIFKGLTTEGIQYCFWRGFVCVRGFERKTRAPRPLIARLHFPASHKGKAKIDENQS